MKARSFSTRIWQSGTARLVDPLQLRGNPTLELSKVTGRGGQGQSPLANAGGNDILVYNPELCSGHVQDHYLQYQQPGIITNGILGPNAIAMDGEGNIFVKN